MVACLGYIIICMEAATLILCNLVHRHTLDGHLLRSGHLHYGNAEIFFGRKLSPEPKLYEIMWGDSNTNFNCLDPFRSPPHRGSTHNAMIPTIQHGPVITVANVLLFVTGYGNGHLYINLLVEQFQ